ncbi:hypothetical protein SJI19_15665 [Acerihabitans sp. TG2]|uniref:hypothetical protein n=1 Tax=Acerihabitans sp. TG2 TaxID=3096008 RepID=UPI002B23C224|nr:hypothetical protein [Acerihabitans sp. TG2]MEA9391964.1 hypothetical protein [Acerihabitans sp. TG2]
MILKPLRHANKYSTQFARATLDCDGFALHSGWIVAYCCHPITQEYLCATMEFLCAGAHLPCHSYQDKPELPQGDLAVIRSPNGQHWQAVTDLRGKTGYLISDGSVVHINSLAELPASVTLNAPQQATDTWNGDRWVSVLSGLSNAPLNHQLPPLLK